MADPTLQSFNVFLTERLSAAALDIYGFVEKTLTDYQEEVNRTRQENRRLQRLLDLLYKPEIRLHRADSRQIDLSTRKPEVCVEEKQIQTECIPKEEPDDTDILNPVVTVGVNEENQMPTQVETGGEHSEYEAPHNPTQVITDGEHTEHEKLSRHEQQPSSGYTKKKRRFYCNICSQSFLKRAKVNLHLAVHAANGLLNPTSAVLVCIECGRKTNSNSLMIRHMRVHTDTKTFACSICGKRYKSQRNMKEHMQTHTMEKPYSCEICGTRFNRASSLIKHVKHKHREDMAFKCTQCSQRFKLVIELKQHMRIAHNIIISPWRTAGLTAQKLKS
nr:PREDICTED: gastrula zinc finger protein XlCGF48.2-like isoform X1 [Paralichthys olivaceus]